MSSISRGFVPWERSDAVAWSNFRWTAGICPIFPVLSSSDVADERREAAWTAASCVLMSLVGLAGARILPSVFGAMMSLLLVVSDVVMCRVCVCLCVSEFFFCEMIGLL